MGLRSTRVQGVGVWRGRLSCRIQAAHPSEATKRLPVNLYSCGLGPRA